MKKSWLALGLTAVILAGCGTEETGNSKKTDENTETAKEETAAFPVTVTGADKQEVEIEAAPKRIVTLMPSVTEIAFELNLGDQIVGVTDNDTYPKEVNEKERVGGMELNVEKVLSLNPDLVLADISTDEKAITQIRDAGIDVLVSSEAKSIDQIYTSYELISEATGTQEEAQKDIETVKEGIAAIEEKASQIKEEDVKNVYFEIAGPPEIYSVGKNTFINEVIELVGANNVMNTEEGWPKVSEEAIIEKNPDTILLNYGWYVENATEGVLKRQGWENIAAIQNNEVFEVDGDLTSRPGPRIVQGAEQIAEAIYPDVFAK
ncbi:ABC transporter substrate-binding protein [Domibacillus epiphyticus]|uniref:ABC transporter substrate-binding protein n=1 Tax=Domibacillus epiphyticus TaxID=1714355 RepID=A0A1V2AAR8_9BACI|nr:ABC transporter substrate-binding protein [Domibacillus epiphyticus]OMP68081.1 ABC transporter substrate-binding protein [Domibacillus epiphyticus]